MRHREEDRHERERDNLPSTSYYLKRNSRHSFAADDYCRSDTEARESLQCVAHNHTAQSADHKKLSLTHSTRCRHLLQSISRENIKITRTYIYTFTSKNAVCQQKCIEEID